MCFYTFLPLFFYVAPKFGFVRISTNKWKDADDADHAARCKFRITPRVTNKGGTPVLECFSGVKKTNTHFAGHCNVFNEYSRDMREHTSQIASPSPWHASFPREFSGQLVFHLGRSEKSGRYREASHLKSYQCSGFILQNNFRNSRDK